MKVLVTGATGFVGRHVIDFLRRAGHDVTGTVRAAGEVSDDNVMVADSSTDFLPLLHGKDAVVHAAGVAHNPTSDPVKLKQLFDEGNRDWTQRIAAAVQSSSVIAMIHISSIAAAGKTAAVHQNGFREEDESEPETDYGRSKREAEKFVTSLGDSGNLGVNLRPPLIYGAGTKGNWAKIVGLAKSPLPIPFASVRNQRSYLGIDNLCELIGAILERSDRSDLSGTYHVADHDLYSLAEVVEALRRGIGRNPGMIPFPVSIMRSALRAGGKQKMAEGLFDDLVLNTGMVEDAFDWTPSMPTLEGMQKSIASEA